MAIQIIRKLLNLRDVNADDIEDGETLVWDADNSEFIPGSGGGGGGAPTDATYITQTANGDLSAEQALSSLSTGLVKVTTTTGVLSTAVANTDYPAVTHATRHENGGADEISLAGLDGTSTALQAHLDDTSDAHDASAISIADSGNDFTATDVEGALAELQADHETDEAALSAHIGDSSAAHAASAISFSPTGNLAATDAQAAIAEAATDAATALSTHESDTTSVHGITDTSTLYRSGGTDVALADGGTGASLADPGADRIMFWDDSAGATAYLTAGTGLTITDTTITASGGSTDGWTADADTWTYASASTFTVSGDVTERFSKGTRLKFTQTSVKYAVVVSSSHAAGTTTVTIGVNSDYTLANAAISATYYSYQVNPQGYPGWFNFVPTVTGYSSPPAVTYCRYNIMGPRCIFAFDNFNTSGNTSGTAFTVTMPVTPLTTNLVAPMQFANNSTTGTTPGAALLQSSTVLALFRDWTGAAWTASGNKWARILIEFQF